MNIEDTLREYDWVIRLGLIAVAMVLCALIVNRFVAAWWLAPKTVPKTRDFSSRKAPDQANTTNQMDDSQKKSWDDAIVDRCPFGCPDQKEDEPKKCPGGCPEGKKCQDGVCVPTEPKKDKPDKPDVPIESDLNIRLMGCMVARQPQYSMALIQDGESEENYIVSTGDQLPNKAKVVRIKRDRIFVRHEGQLEYIQLEETIGGDPSPVSIQSGAAPSPPTASSEAVAGALQQVDRSSSDESAANDGNSGGDDEVQQLSESEYAVNRNALEERLENPGGLSKEVRVIPNYDKSGEQRRGVKLMGVSPSGIYSKLGLQSGDVLRSVNGREVGSQRDAYEMMETFKEEGSISVQIERDGRSVERDYKLK